MGAVGAAGPMVSAVGGVADGRDAIFPPYDDEQPDESSGAAHQMLAAHPPLAERTASHATVQAAGTVTCAAVYAGTQQEVAMLAASSAASAGADVDAVAGTVSSAGVRPEGATRVKEVTWLEGVGESADTTEAPGGAVAVAAGAMAGSQICEGRGLPSFTPIASRQKEVSKRALQAALMRVQMHLPTRYHPCIRLRMQQAHGMCMHAARARHAWTRHVHAIRAPTCAGEQARLARSPG